MADFPDDEERFRSSVLDASVDAAGTNVPLGQFDRHSLVLWLNPGLSADLDSKGGSLPRYSIEPPDSGSMRAFSAHLHETIHYWQTIGSTAGFLHTLGDATSALSIMDDLIVSKHRRKPILRTVSEHAAPEDPALLAGVRWSHIEYGLAMLDDPARTVALLQHNATHFVSPGQSLLSLCANSAASLADAFDRDFNGLITPEPWMVAYEKYVANQHVGFEVEGVLEIPLGLRDIEEAQARISEIQHRDLTQQAVSWQDVKTNGWLSSPYSRAFERFLELARIEEPETPRDDAINLFLLLCDVALNPSVGYADALDPARQFLLDFHPGIRFERLCRVVSRTPELLSGQELPSLDAYETISRRLCEVLQWKTPSEVARTLLERWERATLGDELADQQASRNYGSVDVHRRFLIGEHRNFLDTRVQIPHFFCWPAWAVLVFEGDEDYAANIDEVLGWHRSPFTAEENRGVTTVEIPRLSPQSESQFLSDYFAALSLYDLSRQWVAKPGPFRWNRFRWKPQLTDRDVGQLKKRFEMTYAIALSSVTVR